MKKRIVGSVLAAILVVVSAFCFVGCGEEPYEPVYAWGKSFDFRGVTIDSKQDRGGSPETGLGMSVGDLIKSEYGKNNLDFANAEINGRNVDLTSRKGANADEFIANLDALARDELNDIYSGLVFTIGSKENPTLKITKDAGEEKIYELKKNEQAQGEFYYVMSDSSYGETPHPVGSFDADIARNVNGAPTKGCLGLLLNGEKSVGQYVLVAILIPTKEICNDLSAGSNTNENGEIVSTFIRLGYTPYFSERLPD